MKISDIMQIETTKGIATKDLRKMTQQLQDAANKRVQRMLEDPIGKYSIPAELLRQRRDEGQSGYYSMKDIQTRDQLVARFRAIKSFMSPERTGSSLSAFKKTYKDIIKALGEAPGSAFWKAYREIAKMYPDGNFPGGYGSTEVQRILARTFNTADSWEDTIDKTLAILTQTYEEQEEAEYEEFFELDPDDEDIPF